MIVAPKSFQGTISILHGETLSALGSNTSRNMNKSAEKKRVSGPRLDGRGLFVA